MVRFRRVDHLLVRFVYVVMEVSTEQALMHAIVVANRDIKPKYVQLASANS